MASPRSAVSYRKPNNPRPSWREIWCRGRIGRVTTLSRWNLRVQSPPASPVCSVSSVVEPPAHNRIVPGSSPGRSTNGAVILTVRKLFAKQSVTRKGVQVQVLPAPPIRGSHGFDRLSKEQHFTGMSPPLRDKNKIETTLRLLQFIPRSWLWLLFGGLPDRLTGTKTKHPLPGKLLRSKIGTTKRFPVCS